MKPLNDNADGCSPVSSNCVIWQGDDIACISLCKGDTVSTVVAKLATELCTILEYTKISNYDLKCLTLNNCPPKDFEVLIQLIIDKLCALDAEVNGAPSPARTIGNTCPDCEVVVAPCFRFTNQFGDLVTSMNFTDYVTAIGNKVCTIVSQISTIQATLVNHETRITILENEEPPVYTPPMVTPVCVLPSNPTDMNIVLSALEAQFCDLIGATGTGSNIYDALTRQCAGLNGQPQLGGVGTMGVIPNWVMNVQNLAGSINNLWLTICDLRAAIATIQANCCPSGCDGISLGLTAGLTGSVLKLYIVGTIPVGFAQCLPGTTTFTIKDQSGNQVTYPVDIIAAINVIGGFPIDLSVTTINLSDDLTITAAPCLENITTGSTCQYALSYVAVYPGTCPAMTYVQTDTAILFTGLVSTTGTFVVELWNNAGTTLITSQTSNLSSGATLAGTFGGLTASTTYKIRVKVIPGGDGEPLYCPFTSIQTSVALCPPPTNLVATINII